MRDNARNILGAGHKVKGKNHVRFGAQCSIRFLGLFVASFLGCSALPTKTLSDFRSANNDARDNKG